MQNLNKCQTNSLSNSVADCIAHFMTSNTKTTPFTICCIIISFMSLLNDADLVHESIL